MRGGDRPRLPSMMWKHLRFLADGEVVVSLGSFRKHASIFFARGTELEDPAGVLEGSGKQLGYVTLRAPGDAKRAEVKELVRAAFALAARERRARG